jgi:DNA topoisomerase-1
MSDSLIIVESPTKVKTIKNYLGSNYDVKATMGHIKDLPKSKLGIDMEHHFEPTYQLIESKKKIINELKKAANNAQNIYLAPDPDREGEAIAWQVAEEIGKKNKNIYRVLFNDMTKNTILEAIQHPQEIDFNKYEAQQTRRTLDRLVGYQISPVLWEKVKRGLSAGRVQSIAVRIICDREDEIKRFVPEEYWHITATLQGSNPPSFEARLIKKDAKKLKIGNETQANAVLDELKNVPFHVDKIERKEVKRSPLPPFTTSKLQQEASRWLRFSAKKTMSVAQQLYEGVEIGQEGFIGLITYMRTDSVRIAEEALNDVRNYISQNYEASYLPAKNKIYKNAATAQDAHEAIRPTSMNYKPQSIKAHLSNDQFKLYQLIWNRFVSSQMNPALFDQTIISIKAGQYLFQTQGSIMKFPGFTILYTESTENNEAETEHGKILPQLSENELLSLLLLKPEQKFTQPPPRFSEASLVRELEEKGIGRPSTYATILSTIQDRNYVRLESGKFFPTELGVLVNELLVKNFPMVMDIAFTASLENKLDMIEEGKITRIETLTDFYNLFADELKKAKTQMKNVKREEIPTDHICNKCGSPMVIKWGKNGKFIACSNYPSCKNTMNITSNSDSPQKTTETPPVTTICDKCGSPMTIKRGKFGRFLGCSKYPECKNTMPINIGVKCPVEGCSGFITEKTSKKGKIFYGCSNYPSCTFALWNKPILEPCPSCQSPFLIEKNIRTKGLSKACPNKDCTYNSGM